MFFVVSILYPLCSCMRFHCVCFSDLTVIHILYRSSFDVSGSQISLFPCSIILHGAAPHDSAGFLFQTEIIEFNFWFIVEITVAKIVQMLSFLGLSRLGRRDCSIPTSVTHCTDQKQKRIRFEGSYILVTFEIWFESLFVQKLRCGTTVWSPLNTKVKVQSCHGS